MDNAGMVETASSTTRPKVVRIIGRLNIGGPARQACYLHHALRDEFDTTLIAGHLDVQEGDMSYLLAPDEPGVEWLGSMSRPIRLWNDLLSMLAILRVLRRVKPQIVHTHTAKAGAVGRVAAILAGVPVLVHTYHGHVFRGYFNNAATWIFQCIERMLNLFTTRVIALSESQASELADEFQVVPRSKVTVLSNGFEFPIHVGSADASAARSHLRQELALNADDFVALWTGRLVPIKGVDLLADVIREAQQKAPHMVFLIAGDGILKQELFERTAGCTNLKWLGWRKDISELWFAADCALLTSLNEGTPAALIEAMAAGKPFVSVEVGGVGDLAMDAKAMPNLPGAKQAGNGFITERNSNVLLQCLQQVAQDPQLAQDMGRMGCALAHGKYSSKRLKLDMAALYHQLLKKA